MRLGDLDALLKLVPPEEIVARMAIMNAPTVEDRPIGELMEFARWVAKEVLDNYFEESSGAFAEIACRKLVKLGLVEIKDNVYKMKGGEGDD